MRCLLRLLDLLTKPCTWYPLLNKSSAKNEPSCPVIPVMSAFFLCSIIELLDLIFYILLFKKRKSLQIWTMAGWNSSDLLTTSSGRIQIVAEYYSFGFIAVTSASLSCTAY